ncbi:prepilin-type N-terminal cleavage/methylation domain-containing protein [Enterobacteriaceae bacterium H20N1]|uniref:Prepilin-type N-terminal cleavage/methylation domain-containing protein n=1 Tax=Dryocola boscaweniae TaxID=2925397 RepID=A0A9X2W940_9ENTR|nr:prepilin-type N-terminal cleavage/methylation domain-containing protein [Dryocola boscaweniae]MCT4702781.1 prepilin-type N-terminal cleavage/methylation domain-containing protein [Dryocola boscaweniae]MCT4715428.1 prepilin-type N-terminal cleavage/methylation domain-containing protein [Dryocola boscaweniae]MCT4719949.1 prepilin-type N-terminal cleavage/methylation domain-containing protein [Dryocola boscaweniae]
MPASTVKAKQSGFSLPEVLCSLALFAVVMMALLGYHRVLQQGFQAQWQFRYLWRLAVEMSEPLVPDPLPEWKVIRQQTSEAGCVSIAVTITSPAGRSGQLSRLHCPQEEKSQE